MNRNFRQIDTLSWHCFSIYYAVDEWHKMIEYIVAYAKRTPNIYQYITFFSSERGEHIRLLVASYTTQPEKVQDEVFVSLQNLVKIHPSKDTDSTLYGQELWRHFPVNTVIRNGFQIPEDIVSQPVLCTIGQANSQLLALLLCGDTTEENRISVALFLYLHLFLSNNFILDSNMFDSLKKMITDKIDSGTIDLLQSYWEYKTENEMERDILDTILKERDRLYASMEADQGINTICWMIEEQLGVKNETFLYLTELIKSSISEVSH